MLARHTRGYWLTLAIGSDDDRHAPARLGQENGVARKARVAVPRVGIVPETAVESSANSQPTRSLYGY